MNATEAEARSHLYGLLARLFRAEVDAELLAALRRPPLAAALAAAGADPARTLPEGDDAALLEDLAREYCRLFLLNFSPHESVQRGEGQLWGKHTARVQAVLDQLGLAPAGGLSLLPDHLATELEIMMHLAELEAAGDRRAREAQRAFLDEHLLRWAPAYLGRIERNAAHPFYAALAAFAAAFLWSEGE